MNLEDIYRFFQNPPPTYFNVELTVCYILFVLLQEDSYGTELLQRVEREYPKYRLSDTVLYSALSFLEKEEFISGYWQKVVGRGRPRRMYQLMPHVRDRSQALAHLWQEYIQRHGYEVSGD